VVPTGGVTRSAGDALAGRAGATVTLTLVTTIQERQSRNVLAQTRTGNPDEVVVAGAHLDSVPEGPGINDNGTGVATLLETAVRLGASPPVTNAARFAFWGAEEVGLVGSTSYVNGLPEEERTRIALYLNLDMVGSPNAGYLVYDGDDSDREGDGPGPPGSAAIERAFVEGLADAGVPAAGTDFSGRSDYGPFIERGIPAGGLFTGAEEIKSAEEAQRWGGTAGEAYDRCYHQACDRLDTVDRTALDRNTDAFAATLARFALSTEELRAG
jgi:Zn-dependent M28 family amino/carboxypeptidase